MSDGHVTFAAADGLGPIIRAEIGSDGRLVTLTEDGVIDGVSLPDTTAGEATA